jgi:hypothetical protein
MNRTQEPVAAGYLLKADPRPSTAWAVDDGEVDDSEREPSLGAAESSIEEQDKWAAGGRIDREKETI